MAYSFVSNGPGTVRCVETGCTIVDTAHERGAHESAHASRLVAGRANAAPVTAQAVASAQALELRAMAAEIAALRAERAAGSSKPQEPKK
jgi:hypothetical protein